MDEDAFWELRPEELVEPVRARDDFIPADLIMAGVYTAELWAAREHGDWELANTAIVRLARLGVHIRVAVGHGEPPASRTAATA